MKKKRVELLLLLAVMIFSGCQRTVKEELKEDKKTVEETQNETKEAQPEEEASQKKDNDEKAETEKFLEVAAGEVILEDKEAVYACGKYQIMKIDKESGKSAVLWNDEKRNDSLEQFSEGNALLLGDWIYFISASSSEAAEEVVSLAMMKTDGTNYTQIEELAGYGHLLFYKDGILYVSSSEIENVYQIEEDGKITRVEEKDQKLFSPKIPEGCRKYTGMSIMEGILQYGFYFLYDQDYNLVRLEPDKQEETKVDLEGSIWGRNYDYFLSMKYETDERSLYITNLRTLETRFLADCDINSSFVDMDDAFVYIITSQKEEETGQKTFIYQKISIETGETEKLFEQIAPAGMGTAYDPYYIMNLTVKDGYLYYPGTKDYRLFLMRRKVEEPIAEEILGKPFYDSGISAVGHIETYYENLYSVSKPELTIGNIDMERLVFDKQYPGAEEINQYLKQNEEDVINYIKEGTGWVDEYVELDEQEAGIMYVNCNRNISKIYYVDETYVSFYMHDHEYQGGAHGMSYWIGCTFDLQTGKRLQLADIIDNSEEELKEIVTGYFREMIEKNPDDYWEDAIDIVREETDFEMGFYLTDSGIDFYFEPYLLSSYGAGFQEITIPYSEFRLKITIG